jgi:Aspartyl protease
MTTRVAEFLRVPIRFQAADGSAVHAPLVAGTVAGVDTLLVLDTGSEVHLLTTETAERAGLALEPGEEGTDHAGISMPSWSAGGVELTLTGRTLTLRDVVVIPAPPPFPGYGIGGILSPQHLDGEARIVIDLARDELTFVDGTPDEVTTWLAARAPDSTTLVLERDGRTATPVVAGAIEPFPQTAVMLNTGGRGTEFDETVVPGLAAGKHERLGGGVSGADVVGTRAGDQVLLVGSSRIAVASLAVRRNMGDPSGLVGMDVLRGTVLALDADPGGVVTWQLGGQA